MTPKHSTKSGTIPTSYRYMYLTRPADLSSWVQVGRSAHSQLPIHKVHVPSAFAAAPR